MCQPGIRRDGTLLEGGQWAAGQWVRFDRGRPRKMRGYKSISNSLSDESTQLITQTTNGTSYIHSGYGGGLDALTLSSTGLSTQTISRTPSAFVADHHITWQFATIYDPQSGAQQLIAVPTYSLLDPTNTTIGNGTYLGTGNGTNLFNGQIYGSSALTAFAYPPNGTAGAAASESATGPGVSGGVCILNPYTILYGSNGYFAWSTPTAPLDFQNATGTGSGSANITAQKILRGMPLRGGGGYSPAGLFWSVDSLIRATYIGTPTIWQFDTLSAETSLLSANCIVESDGLFYWAGADGRFYMYNGSVQEIPNEMNLNWFYDGINQTYAGRSFAFRNPRWGEIWWCYPRGSATDCSHAVIYNYRKRVWYDTPLPGIGRSAGILGDAGLGPIMCDWQQNGSGNSAYINSVATGTTTTIQTTSSPGWFVGSEVTLQNVGGVSQLNSTHQYVTAVPAAQTVSGISQASSAVVTVSTVSVSNPFATGNIIYFSGIIGMTQINGLSGTVSAIGGASGAWTATVNINSSAFTSWSAGAGQTATITNVFTVNANTSGSTYTSGGSMQINQYTLWQHEVGVDEVSGSNVFPIDAYIESTPFTTLHIQQPNFSGLSASILESDFVISGPMTVTIRGQSSALGANVDSPPYQITPSIAVGTTAVTPVKETRRQMRLKFESNSVGGDFQMGECWLHVVPDSKRFTT
jgi:hypothetical protein